MTTTVIHYRDRKPGDIYIGRAGRGEIGYFGNPYRAGRQCLRCRAVHPTGYATLACFKAYFAHRLRADKEFAARVEELRGKRLVCFCKPEPCHGDIIVEYLDGDDALCAECRHAARDHYVTGCAVGAGNRERSGAKWCSCKMFRAL